MRAIQPCNTDTYCIVVMSWHCQLAIYVQTNLIMAQCYNAQQQHTVLVKCASDGSKRWVKLSHISDCTSDRQTYVNWIGSCQHDIRRLPCINALDKYRYTEFNTKKRDKNKLLLWLSFRDNMGDLWACITHRINHSFTGKDNQIVPRLSALLSNSVRWPCHVLDMKLSLTLFSTLLLFTYLLKY